MDLLFLFFDQPAGLIKQTEQTPPSTKSRWMEESLCYCIVTAGHFHCQNTLISATASCLQELIKWQFSIPIQEKLVVRLILLSGNGYWWIEIQPVLAESGVMKSQHFSQLLECNLVFCTIGQKFVFMAFSLDNGILPFKRKAGMTDLCEPLIHYMICLLV